MHYISTWDTEGSKCDGEAAGETGLLGGEANEVALERLLGGLADLFRGTIADEAERFGNKVEVAAIMAGTICDTVTRRRIRFRPR